VLGGGMAQEIPERIGIAERPVPRLAVDAVARDHAVEVVTLAGIEPAREAYAAECACPEAQSGALKLMPHESVVEAGVVRDEDPSRQASRQLAGQVREARRVGDHLARDAGERLDLGRDRGARVDERRPAGSNLETVDFEHRDLGDAVDRRPGTGGLDVDDRQGFVPQHDWIYLQLIY
jgi:hypothetical protein